jgi:hypothetical protein
MAQHVGVDWKGEAGARADALDEPIDGIRRERPAALGGEDEGRVRALPAQLAQRSHLVAAQRMALGLPFLARRTCSVAARLSSTCDHPADTTGPRSINVYLFEVRDFSAEAAGGADAKRFKIEPQRLLYSLQRLHNGTPPDFQLQLAR